MGWIDAFMNQAKVKATLGIDKAASFASCNMDVNQAFALQGDGAHNSAALLPELIDDGLKLLVYAGNADMMCNYLVRPPLPISSVQLLTDHSGQRALG